jgi:hypothetical protein
VKRGRERERGEERERRERGEERERDCQVVPGMSFNMRLRFSEPEKQPLAWVFTEKLFNY